MKAEGENTLVKINQPHWTPLLHNPEELVQERGKMLYMKKACISQSLDLAEIDPLCALYYPWIHQGDTEKGQKMEVGALLEGEGPMSKELALD